jgi:CheY-like chemotaxis protein
MRNDLLQRALTDAETGLPNERFLALERERVEARSQRYRFPVGIITITCHGCEGRRPQPVRPDAALSVRAADLLARTGDAELQLIVTHRDTEGLSMVVDRLHRLCRGVRRRGPFDRRRADARRGPRRGRRLTMAGQGAPGRGRWDPAMEVVGMHRKKLILTVDDEAAQRQIFSSYLTFAGYEVIEAANGVEGLRMARDRGPDLILLDIGMPVLDGWGTMVLLGDDPTTSSIPVVALTAYDLSATQLREAGFCGYLEKPIVPYRVLEEVEACIGPSDPAAQGSRAPGSRAGRDARGLDPGGVPGTGSTVRRAASDPIPARHALATDHHGDECSWVGGAGPAARCTVVAESIDAAASLPWRVDRLHPHPPVSRGRRSLPR